jgi:short-subunit dehydrogenase
LAAVQPESAAGGPLARTVSAVEWTGAAVVVTGGSGGIGLAVARAAVARRARVGLIARDGPRLELAAASLAVPAPVVAADVTDGAAVADAMGLLTEQLGPIDVLVNSAGAGGAGPAAATTTAVTGRLLATNFAGVLHPTLAVLPSMQARRRGHIVVIGSIAGRLGVAGEAAYSASKFAVNGFTEALALELRGSGVGVSVVSPGAVATGFFAARGTPYGRRWPPPMPPERVAAAVIKAVERNRFDIVVPGWLRAALAVRALAPNAYRWAATRAEGSASSGR